jgi:hypothetical protein
MTLLEFRKSSFQWFTRGKEIFVYNRKEVEAIYGHRSDNAEILVTGHETQADALVYLKELLEIQILEIQVMLENLDK